MLINKNNNNFKHVAYFFFFNLFKTVQLITTVNCIIVQCRITQKTAHPIRVHYRLIIPVDIHTIRKEFSNSLQFVFDVWKRVVPICNHNDTAIGTISWTLEWRCITHTCVENVCGSARFEWRKRSRNWRVWNLACRRNTNIDWIKLKNDNKKT